MAKTRKPKKADFLEYEIWVSLSDSGAARKRGATPGGFNEFNVSTFTEGNLYRTVGLTYHFYEDGSRILCWMVFDDDNVLQTKSVTEFRLPESDEIKEIVIRNAEFTNEQKVERVDGKPISLKSLLGKKILAIGNEQLSPDGTFIVIIVGNKKE